MYSYMEGAQRSGVEMAERVALAVIMVIMWAAGAASAQQSSCTTTLISLSPCLSYITGNASATPAPSCCTQLASVVASQPRCLCMVLSGEAGRALGLTIDRNRALALPVACKVQTPPVSRCDASSPADSPIAPTTGSEGRRSSSDASTIQLVAARTSLVFISLLIASVCVASLTDD